MWLIGFYARLSKDENQERVDSLETQVAYISQYNKDKKIGTIVGQYIDDDITGVLFDGERKEFTRLIDDIEKGIINCIIVKDLSRLGRLNSKTLTFFDYLIEKSVRLIAIDDNYDSSRDNDDLIGIKTWYNEQYVKDISRKSRSNIHQKLKNGEYLGTPPFGYRKQYMIINNVRKPVNKLLVDEQIRPIIKEIFQLYIEGFGYRNIADKMTEKGYINPSQYKNYNRPQAARWTTDHIKRIIQNPVYCGDTVQGISEKISYKTKKTRKRPKSQWYITKNTHEPIIDRETWLLANEINVKRANENVRNKKTVSLFSSFLVCGACGQSLTVRRRKNKPMGYICLSYHHYGKGVGGCTTHWVRDDDMQRVVLDRISKIFKEEDVIEGIEEYLKQYKPIDYKTAILALKKEVEKYTRHLETMYEDRLNRVISLNFYSSKTKDIKTKVDTLNNQIATLQKESTQQKTVEQDKERLLKTFFEIVENQNITRGFLEQCIDKIYVFQPGEIKDNKKTMELLVTNGATVRRLQNEGGLFIKYKITM